MSDVNDGSGVVSGCSYIVRLWPVWLVFAIVLFVMFIGQTIDNIVVEVTPQSTDDVDVNNTGADGIGTVVDEFTQVDWPGVCASAYVLPVVWLAMLLLRNE